MKCDPAMYTCANVHRWHPDGKHGHVPKTTSKQSGDAAKQRTGRTTNRSRRKWREAARSCYGLLTTNSLVFLAPREIGPRKEVDVNTLACLRTSDPNIKFCGPDNFLTSMPFFFAQSFRIFCYVGVLLFHIASLQERTYTDTCNMRQESLSIRSMRSNQFWSEALLPKLQCLRGGYENHESCISTKATIGKITRHIAQDKKSTSDMKMNDMDESQHDSLSSHVAVSSVIDESGADVSNEVASSIRARKSKGADVFTDHNAAFATPGAEGEAISGPGAAATLGGEMAGGGGDVAGGEDESAAPDDRGECDPPFFNGMRVRLLSIARQTRACLSRARAVRGAPASRACAARAARGGEGPGPRAAASSAAAAAAAAASSAAAAAAAAAGAVPLHRRGLRHRAVVPRAPPLPAHSPSIPPASPSIHHPFIPPPSPLHPPSIIPLRRGERSARSDQHAAAARSEQQQAGRSSKQQRAASSEQQRAAASSEQQQPAASSHQRPATSDQQAASSITGSLQPARCCGSSRRGSRDLLLQKRSERDPKEIRTRSERDPKEIRKRSERDPKEIRKRSERDPKEIRK
jgi:hypothetical protein